MIVINDQYIEHFGKKGMHWGVRKANMSSKSRKRKLNKAFDDVLSREAGVNIHSKAYADKVQPPKSLAEATHKVKMHERAAKYIVDRNMSIDDAMSKSRADSRKNAAVLVAASSAISITAVYKILNM